MKIEIEKFEEESNERLLKEQLRCMCVNMGMGRRDKCNEIRKNRTKNPGKQVL